jgi:hypothetical protein
LDFLRMRWPRQRFSIQHTEFDHSRLAVTAQRDYD